MKEMKKEYERERKILDEAIGKAAGDNIRIPAQVMELQHFGSTLKKPI